MSEKVILSVRWHRKNENQESVEKRWNLEIDTVTLNQYQLVPSRIKNESTLFGPLLDDVMNKDFDIKYPIRIFYQGKLFDQFVISYRHYRYRHFMDVINLNPMLGDSETKQYIEDYYIIRYANSVRTTQEEFEKFVWKIADEDYVPKDLERYLNRLSGRKVYIGRNKGNLMYNGKQVARKQIDQNSVIQANWNKPKQISSVTHHE